MEGQGWATFLSLRKRCKGVWPISEWALRLYSNSIQAWGELLLTRRWVVQKAHCNATAIFNRSGLNVGRFLPCQARMAINSNGVQWRFAGDSLFQSIVARSCSCARVSHNQLAGCVGCDISESGPMNEIRADLDCVGLAGGSGEG